VDGLRVAAVTGHYTAARCRTPAAASARQLMPVTPGRRHAELRPRHPRTAQPQARTPAPAPQAGCYQSWQPRGARSMRSATH
jgi:hypothetical protein